MGVGPSESVNNNPLQETSEMFEINSDNGYFLCNKYFIPEEVLALILSHVPPKDLVFNCRRVCKYWCNIIDSLVWRIKLKRINVPPNKIIELPWFACFWIVTKQPLGRNLIRNSCGEGNLIIHLQLQSQVTCCVTQFKFPCSMQHFYAIK